MLNINQHAALKEQQGEMLAACFLWKKALSAATSPTQKKYCSRRAAFCKKQAERNARGIW